MNNRSEPNITTQLIYAKNQIIKKIQPKTKVLLTPLSKHTMLNNHPKYKDFLSFINIKNNTSQVLFIKFKNQLLHNSWATEIFNLSLPPLVLELALNCCKKQNEQQIQFYFRSNKKHLNTVSSQKILSETLRMFFGKKLDIKFIEHNDLTIKTPLELINDFYQQEIEIAHNLMVSDSYLEMLCDFFNASIDKQSIVIM
ncbi:MAG: DNA polymerase III subunit gamma/tau C-terminal domain-containing protein [Candidatus Dasytiphilus stammeri]